MIDVIDESRYKREKAEFDELFDNLAQKRAYYKALKVMKRYPKVMEILK